MKIFFKYSITLVVLLSCFELQVFGQNFNVQSAANYIRYKEIDKAKEAIDKAAAHESTSSDPKMYMYRSRVYYQIAANPKWQSLDANAIKVSGESIIKTFELDVKKRYIKDVKPLMGGAATGIYNLGVDAEQKSDYVKAKDYYQIIFDLMKYDEDKNIARNNITEELLHERFYSIAASTKDYSEAKKQLQILMDKNYNEPKIYAWMSNILVEEKDLDGAIESINKGRAIYDDNKDLLNQEIYLYNLAGKSEELIKKLGDAIAADDQNELYYYNRGTLYYQAKDYKKAKEDLSKSIELKPDYYDALINLSAIYGDQANEKIEQMNKLSMSQQKEYDKLKAEKDELFKQAAKYLQQAVDAPNEDPQFIATLKTLREIYVKVGDYANAKIIKGKIDEEQSKAQ